MKVSLQAVALHPSVSAVQRGLPHVAMDGTTWTPHMYPLRYANALRSICRHLRSASFRVPKV